MNFGNFPPIILLISTHLDFTPSVLSTSHPLIFILIEKQNKTFFVSNKRWWVDISWFSPLTCPTSVFFREPGPGERREGAPCLGARVPGVPSPSLCTTVICHLLTHDPARSCLGFWASVPEPISLPPLAAVAVSAPHTQLMLLWRRLAAMTELLKSVDYEVFGTVQGTVWPGMPRRGRGRERRKLMPSILGTVLLTEAATSAQPWHSSPGRGERASAGRREVTLGSRRGRCKPIGWGWGTPKCGRKARVPEWYWVIYFVRGCSPSPASNFSFLGFGDWTLYIYTQSYICVLDCWSTLPGHLSEVLKFLFDYKLK